MTEEDPLKGTNLRPKRKLDRMLPVMAAIAGVVLLGLVVYTLVSNRSTLTETCRVQQIGLAANRYLVGSLNDLHLLLTLPPTAEEKARPVPHHTRVLLDDLNRNLAMYVSIENSQPRDRSCPR